jgi:hypothetical protein
MLPRLILMAVAFLVVFVHSNRRLRNSGQTHKTVEASLHGLAASTAVGVILLALWAAKRLHYVATHL